MSVPVKLFIVEDHLVMREMLVAFLTNRSGYEVCGAAESAEEALGRLGELGYELALIDVSLPGISGIELVEAIRLRWPDIRCLMISGHGERSYVERALEAGARGYVLKGDPYELPEAIEQVMSGETYLSESLRVG